MQGLGKEGDEEMRPAQAPSNRTSGVAHVYARPHRLRHFIGQARVLDSIEALLHSADRQWQRIPNLLLIGPEGHGRRLLAMMMASELGAPIRAVPVGAIDCDQMLRQALREFQEGDFVILENLHRLPAGGQRSLANALATRTAPVDDFGAWDEQPLADCVITATTKPDASIASVLKEQFSVTLRLSAYSRSELRRILHEISLRSGCELTPTAARRLLGATEGRSGPSVHLLEQCCRLARITKAVAGRPRIQPSHVATSLATSGLDAIGKDRLERRYLARLRLHGESAERSFSACLRWPRELLNQVEDLLLVDELVRISARRVTPTKKAKNWLGEDE